VQKTSRFREYPECRTPVDSKFTRSRYTPPFTPGGIPAPDSDSEDEPTSTPARAGGVSPHYTDAAGRRIYPEPYQYHPSPAGLSMTSREYNPCGRNDDDRDHPTPYAEDADEQPGLRRRSPGRRGKLCVHGQKHRIGHPMT